MCHFQDIRWRLNDHRRTIPVRHLSDKESFVADIEPYIRWTVSRWIIKERSRLLFIFNRLYPYQAYPFHPGLIFVKSMHAWLFVGSTFNINSKASAKVLRTPSALNVFLTRIWVRNTYLPMLSGQFTIIYYRPMLIFHWMETDNNAILNWSSSENSEIILVDRRWRFDLPYLEIGKAIKCTDPLWTACRSSLKAM